MIRSVERTGNGIVSIIPMRRAHLARVRELSVQLGYENAPSELAERFALLRRDKNHRMFVALLDGKVAGWMHVAARKLLQAEFRLEILGLVVDAGLRGRGVGRALLEHAQCYARENGFKMVSLYSGAKRLAAHRFYARCGYVHSKNSKVFVKKI
jgi:GNAT superfamily N-acetyltransferase